MESRAFSLCHRPHERRECFQSGQDCSPEPIYVKELRGQIPQSDFTRAISPGNIFLQRSATLRRRKPQRQLPEADPQAHLHICRSTRAAAMSCL